MQAAYACCYNGHIGVGQIYVSGGGNTRCKIFVLYRKGYYRPVAGGDWAGFTVEYIACKYGVCRSDGCRYVRGNAYSSEAYQKSVLQKAYSRFLHTRLCFEFYHILYRLQSFLGVYTVCYSFLRSVRSYKLRIFRNGRWLPWLYGADHGPQAEWTRKCLPVLCK